MSAPLAKEAAVSDITFMVGAIPLDKAASKLPPKAGPIASIAGPMASTDLDRPRLCPKELVENFPKASPKDVGDSAENPEEAAPPPEDLLLIPMASKAAPVKELTTTFT